MNDFDTHEKKDMLYKLQSGDVTAFTAVFIHYGKKMSQFAGIRLQNLVGAWKIIQNISSVLSIQREYLNSAGFLPHFISAFVKYVANNLRAKRTRRQLFPLYVFRQNAFLAGNLITKRVRSKRLYELTN